MNQLCHILNANSTWYQTMIAEFITFWHKRIGRRRARRVIRRERNASQSSFPKVKVPLKRPFKRRLCYEKLNYNTSNWALMLMAGRCKSPISKDGRLFRRRFRVSYPISRQIVSLTVIIIMIWYYIKLYNIIWYNII